MIDYLKLWTSISFVGVLLIAGLGVRAQGPDPTSLVAPAATPAEKPATAAAIPLVELSVQADAATLNLREIASTAEASAVLATIERDLPALTREIDARFRENARIISQRPVQVGDLIQMDDATGVVQRIGIRASIVRTPNGSNIIVPHGKLISERLVNWTFSERQRGIDITFSVVLGADTARVIELLERIAAEQPKLLKQPPPHALLTRVGPDWMGFELHAFTNHIEDWMDVRSELAVAVTAALAREDIKLR